MASDPKASVQRNEVEATQGTKRPQLVYVLIGGLVLVVVGFAVVWAFSHH